MESGPKSDPSNNMKTCSQDIHPKNPVAAGLLRRQVLLSPTRGEHSSRLDENSTKSFRGVFKRSGEPVGSELVPSTGIVKRSMNEQTYDLDLIGSLGRVKNLRVLFESMQTRNLECEKIHGPPGPLKRFCPNEAHSDSKCSEGTHKRIDFTRLNAKSGFKFGCSDENEAPPTTSEVTVTKNKEQIVEGSKPFEEIVLCARPNYSGLNFDRSQWNEKENVYSGSSSDGKNKLDRGLCSQNRPRRRSRAGKEKFGPILGCKPPTSVEKTVSLFSRDNSTSEGNRILCSLSTTDSNGTNVCGDRAENFLPRSRDDNLIIKDKPSSPEKRLSPHNSVSTYFLGSLQCRNSQNRIGNAQSLLCPSKINSENEPIAGSLEQNLRDSRVGDASLRRPFLPEIQNVVQLIALHKPTKLENLEFEYNSTKDNKSATDDGKSTTKDYKSTSEDYNSTNKDYKSTQNDSKSPVDISNSPIKYNINTNNDYNSLTGTSYQSWNPLFQNCPNYLCTIARHIPISPENIKN